MVQIALIVQLIQIFENSMAFMYALLVVDSGFSQMQLGLLLAIPGMLGFIFDYLVIRRISGIKWHYTLRAAATGAIGFAFTLFLATKIHSFWLFLLAGMFWYIYFELFSLMQQQYVIQRHNKNEFSKVWGVMYALMQAGGIVGPIIGAVLLNAVSETAVLWHAILMVLIFIVALFFTHDKKEHALPDMNEVKHDESSPVSLFHILKTITPVALAYILLITITEMVQNLGGLYGESLQLGREWSWLLISTFSLALALGPLFLSRYSITQGKKYLSLLLLFLGGCFLILNWFVSSTIPLLVILFCVGLSVSVALPLEEAVFSDFEKRSPHERSLLMTSVRLVASTAFIAAPLLGGYVSDAWGYKAAFTTLGFVIIVATVVIRIFTPRKILIPHKV